MEAPKINLIGVVTSITAVGNMTIVNLLCEIDRKTKSELVPYPVKLFGDHAGNFYLKAPVGSRIEIDCVLSVWVTQDGKIFLNLDGGNYRVLAKPEVAPLQPVQVAPLQPVQDDFDDDLPF